MQLIHNTIIKLGVVALLIGCVLTVNYLQAAWSPPLADPPNDNVDAPINIGTNDQVKNGGLSVDALAVFGNQYVEDSLTVGTTSLSQNLSVDVDGRVGATEYCDENGENCVPASSLGGSGSPSGIPYTIYYGYDDEQPPSSEVLSLCGYTLPVLGSLECFELQENTTHELGSHDICYNTARDVSGLSLVQQGDGIWRLNTSTFPDPLQVVVGCVDLSSFSSFSP